MENPIHPLEVYSWHLYERMLFCRLFEHEVKQLWQAGAIPGEMHLSMGEEGIVVGIVDQLLDGDALALDHRGTAPMLVRGVDPVLLLKEFMGKPDGLDGGKGGHMHLFDPQHMAASSGIVGSSGPAAVGFALANQRLRPGKIAVAFFGEGAVNEGMLLESFNLASVWKLPVMFVCKDNGQAVSTRSSKVTGGSLLERLTAFGLRAVEVDGSDVEEVWKVVNAEISRLRQGEGSVFILASCIHIEGHFLGDQLLRFSHASLGDTLKTFGPLVKAYLGSAGAPLRERYAGVKEILDTASLVNAEINASDRDPIAVLRSKLISLDAEKLRQIEQQLKIEIAGILERVLETGAPVGAQPA